MTQIDENTIENAASKHIRHEARTHIGHIIGYAELLIEECEDGGKSPSSSADLWKIYSAARRLLAMLNGEKLKATESDHSISVDGELKDAIGKGWTLPATSPHTHSSNRLNLQGNILVVDDNEENRTILVQRLKRQHHQVDQAANGRDALEKLALQEFDLVLLDVLMPEMNGYEVLQTLKSNRTLNHIPVIMLSALDDIESVVRCIELGANDYLPKPYNPVLLNARISAGLEQKWLRDQEISYMRNVTLVTDAAVSVEAGTFDPDYLIEVATRQDALGKLARVFQTMGREVQAREQRLKQQVAKLRIEINESRRESQVAMIIETEYFKDLERKAGDLRKQINREDGLHG